jgi:RNA-directed DNA polymerase
VARAINPIVAGWMAYYGRFYRSKLSALLAGVSDRLCKCVT